MTIAIAVISTIVLVILILIWLRSRRVRCRDCKHFGEGYTTTIHGQGLYRFGYCQWEVHDCKAVEPDIGRKCWGFEKMAVKDEGAELKRPRNPKVSIFTPKEKG